MNNTIELKPGVVFDKTWLQHTIQSYETLILFGQLYKLTTDQLSLLLRLCFKHDDMVQALTAGTHATQLQDYCEGIATDIRYDGQVEYTAWGEPEIAEAELFIQLLEAHQVGITSFAAGISTKFGKFLHSLPSHESKFELERLAGMNRRRPSVPFRTMPVVHHAHELENLCILDVSGSQGESLIKSIVGEVVGTAQKFGMHLAIVSTNAYWFRPGEYDVDAVMSHAQFASTCYSELTKIGLFDQHWGTVLTVADYDGMAQAKRDARHATGSIERVVDISTVAQQTFLSQVAATRSSNPIEQLIIAPSNTTVWRDELDFNKELGYIEPDYSWLRIDSSYE